MKLCRSHVLLACLGLLLAVQPAAAQETFRVGLDTDDDPSTGCVFEATDDAFPWPLKGYEQQTSFTPGAEVGVPKLTPGVYALALGAGGARWLPLSATHSWLLPDSFPCLLFSIDILHG